MNEKPRTDWEWVTGTGIHSSETFATRLRDRAASLSLLDHKKPKAPRRDPYNKGVPLGTVGLQKAKRRSLDDMRQLSKAIEAKKVAEAISKDRAEEDAKEDE